MLQKFLSIPDPNYQISNLKILLTMKNRISITLMLALCCIWCAAAPVGYATGNDNAPKSQKSYCEKQGFTLQISGNYAIPISGAYESDEPVQSKKAKYQTTLKYGKYTFTVVQTGDVVTITPSGPGLDKRNLIQTVDGTAVNAEADDLNGDNYPEVLVYITSAGSGSYGSVLALSCNSGKSMSFVTFPSVAENPKLNTGYMGHDEFGVIEGKLNQRFPIYKPGDPNSSPSGGIRQVQYIMKDGENSRVFVVDKVTEF
jgi:hypothetical protein